MVEHVNITDPNIHEPKGASTAANGKVLKANGDGSTSWVSPKVLDNVVLNTLFNANNSNILPSAVDTPIIAGFSSTVSNSFVTIDSSGTITCNSTGYYTIKFSYNFGRSTATGNAVLAARVLVNDVQVGYTRSAVLAANSNSRYIEDVVYLDLNAGDVVKVQIMRDSSGTNDGGLYAVAITPAAWTDVPSFSVAVTRMEGIT